MENFKKNVLVTGSSRGIGWAIAQKYIHGNYNVVLNCINSIDLLHDTIDNYKHINKDIVAIAADVSNYLQVKSMFKEIETKFGGIDILVNNAGISYWEPFNLTKEENFNNIINTNLMSVLYTSHLAIPYMIQKKSGCIINISSIWGNIGASCEVLYSTTKGGVNAFTKSLAKELGPSNINVNAIACGVIDTTMNSFLTKDEKDELKNEIPLNRFGNKEEIANLTMYLSSEEAKYITGQVITIDGGLT